MKFDRRLLALGVAFGLLSGGPAAQAQSVQGVTKDEIVLGSVLDLSGVINVIGLRLKQGMETEVEKINAAGGIHGRKIRLIVEDSAFDPKQAIIATRKLISQDKVFALVGNLGSAIGRVTMPISVEAGVPYLFPGSPIEDMYKPPKRLVFAYNGTLTNQFRQLTKYFYDKGKRAICALRQDDESGEQSMAGIQAAMDEVNAKLVETVSFKSSATDLSAQMVKLKDAKCDMIIATGVIRPVAFATMERQKLGWDVTMAAGQAAALLPLIQLAGPAAENLYGMNIWKPLDDLRKQPQIADLIKNYEEKYKQKFDDLVLTGHEMIALTAEGLRRAGPNLTVDSLVSAIETFKDYDPGYGFTGMTYTPTQRLGSQTQILQQVKNGKWTTVEVVR